MSAAADGLEYLIGNIVERNSAREDAEFVAGSWHAIDGTGRFVLADGQSALMEDGGHSLGTVATHAGHDDSNASISVNLGYRGHQIVNRP